MRIYIVNGRTVWLDERNVPDNAIPLKKPSKPTEAKPEPKKAIAEHETKPEPTKEDKPKTKSRRRPSNKARKAEADK